MTDSLCFFSSIEPSFISLFLSLFMGSLHSLKCATASLQHCLTCSSVPAMSLHWHQDSGRGFTFNFAENVALSGAMFSVRKRTVSAGLSWSDVSSHYCHFLRPLRPSSLTVNTGVWNGWVVGRGTLPSPAFCHIAKQKSLFRILLSADKSSRQHFYILTTTFRCEVVFPCTSLITGEGDRLVICLLPVLVSTSVTCFS